MVRAQFIQARAEPQQIEMTWFKRFLQLGLVFFDLWAYFCEPKIVRGLSSLTTSRAKRRSFSLISGKKNCQRQETKLVPTASFLKRRWLSDFFCGFRLSNIKSWNLGHFEIWAFFVTRPQKFFLFLFLFWAKPSRSFDDSIFERHRDESRLGQVFYFFQKQK